MSHALLLRLFSSPSFFNVTRVLQYMSQYADHIGITHYLTNRLRELETEQLGDVWGFICHLLVTRPSKSTALECFVVERAEQSTHIAMLTLWFMQAAISDLAITRYNSPSFAICQRVLHRCHDLIFGDLPPPAATPYPSQAGTILSRFRRRKVRHHFQPAVIGIGAMLAGVPGMPVLTEVMGRVAIEQGQRVDKEPGAIGVSDIDSPTSLAAPFQQPDVDITDQDPEDSDDMEEEDVEHFGRVSFAKRAQTDSATLKILNPILPSGSPSLSRRRTLGSSRGASRTTPSLGLSLPIGEIISTGQGTLSQASPPSSPSRSYPNIPTVTASRPATIEPSTSAYHYDLHARSLLLRNHYCRSEVNFILSLETIANRLLVVPKLARVSALRAELTALNHNLPAEVCIPMWCPSADTLDTSTGISQPHHRIVRVPPGESVVLNSAERAPYLLLLEILQDDLDFDPSRRGNKELMQRVIAQEDARRTGTQDTTADFGVPRPERDLIADPSDVPVIGVTIPPTPTKQSSAPEEDEEMDLVEQLYGDMSMRSQMPDLSESFVMPSVPKNKVLDLATWSSSNPSTPHLGSRSHPSSPQVEGPSFGDRKAHWSSGSYSSSSAFPSTATPSRFAANMASSDLSLEDYSERMRTAAVMLAQLNANLIREPVTTISAPGTNATLQPQTAPTVVPAPAGASSWLPGRGWILGGSSSPTPQPGDPPPPPTMRMKLQHAEAAAIRDRIMKEMMALEEERMERMKETGHGEALPSARDLGRRGARNAEDEGIVRRELSKADPSAAVFRESWAGKKARIRAGSPYGHLSNWDCISVIVKTGADLRQEQLAVRLILEFGRIWKEENCPCWVKPFRILITGRNSGLVETVTDSVSIHSIKKAEYAKRIAEGRFNHVSLMDHFVNTYGDPSSAKFARARHNFAKSLAGYSLVSYLLQLKDRHNGNLLLDRDGHIIHIDFGFMLSNSPGNLGFEAAPFKLPMEYIDVLGGIEGESFLEFKKLFHEGFEAARKHCDRIITIVDLMQKDSSFPCFAAFGEQTAHYLRERFQPAMAHSLLAEHVEKLIITSMGSAWTRLYDSFQYYSQSIL